MSYMVQFRKQITENTDPQRRCYNGCSFSERTYWSGWETLSSFDTEKEALDLADLYRRNHAIDAREGTRREYRVEHVLLEDSISAILGAEPEKDEQDCLSCGRQCPNDCPQDEEARDRRRLAEDKES